MKKAKISLSAVAVGALVATGLATAPSANATPHRRAVARTAPRWVARAHSLGAASAAGTSTFKVYLAPRGGTDALKAAVAAVSDPSSSSYRHYLSAAQYHARFDASSATVSKVSAFLRSNHLKVTSVAPHHRYLQVSGSNAHVQKAFAVAIKRYNHLGQRVQANDRAVTLPATVASYVTTVTGLDTTRQVVKHFAVAPPAGYRNARPCSRYYGQVAAKYAADYTTKLPKFKGRTLPYAVCGYTGPQYRAAYEGNAAQDGSGVSVAVIDAFASPTIASDADQYASTHGDGSYTGGQLKQHVPLTFSHETDDVCGGAAGWYGEETLDVEAVHAMAPGATIHYYGARSCEDDDILFAQQKVVDQNKVAIVTNSYGEPEEAVSAELQAAENQVFLQGAMQGISFLFSSGDNGDELASTAIKQADSSASNPYVTAVGGTADAIDGNGQFSFQTGWGTEKYSLAANGSSWTPVGYLYGAGGGSSALFNKPGYQEGVVPSRYGQGRAVPDIAMDADPTTGMLVGETQTFSDGTYYGEYRIGGTSLASPLLAGMTALAAQKAGGRLGFLNPAIYKAAGSSAYNDVKGAPADAGNVRIDYANGENASGGLLYSVRTFNQDSSLSTAPGWDDVTGVGSPNASWISRIGVAAAR